MQLDGLTPSAELMLETVLFISNGFVYIGLLRKWPDCS